MPNKQRYTNNVSNPLLKVINADSQLQENPTSTDRNLNVQLFGDDSGTVRKVAVNASGHILTDIEPDPESGLATAANQTNGNQISKSMGSEDGATTGTQRQIHVDGSGNQLVSVVSTVNTLPANSGNSGITDDPANSFAVGMRARTDPALASSEKFVKCDGNGSLIVDASKEGIVTSNGTTESLHSMMMATNDNVNLRTVSCDDDGAVNIINDQLTYDNSTTLMNNVTIADGASVDATAFDLGSKVDRSQLGNLEFFVDNSNSVPLTIKAIVSPDGGSKFYDNVHGNVVSSSGGAINFNQDDVMSLGNKHFKLQVTNNHGGGTSTDVTIRVAYYH